MIELKPCPYCGETPKRPEAFFGPDGENLWGVSCENVNCHVDIGVWHEDEDEAICMWNALSRPLRWTKEPPTEQGWYWFRNLSKPQIVHTSGIKHRKPHPADEWAGPIQEPVE